AGSISMSLGSPVAASGVSAVSASAASGKATGKILPLAVAASAAIAVPDASFGSMESAESAGKALDMAVPPAFRERSFSSSAKPLVGDAAGSSPPAPEAVLTEGRAAESWSEEGVEESIDAPFTLLLPRLFRVRARSPRDRGFVPHGAFAQAGGKPAVLLFRALVAAIGRGQIGEPGIGLFARVSGLPCGGEPERMELAR